MALVETACAQGVMTIRLNRPERLNALGREMREAIEIAVGEARARVVVFEGAGHAFSAGADLKDPDLPGPHASWAERRRAAGRWGRLLDEIEALPQVTVASLHGAVVGGAVLLALACDLRVAASDLAMSIPELALGIPLTWGGLPRLVREIGVPRTRELVLTGRTVGADEALRWGLVHRVGESREAETDRLIQELLAMPEAPAAVTKEALRALGRTVVSFEAAWADPDLLEGARREPESERAALDYLERIAAERERRRAGHPQRDPAD